MDLGRSSDLGMADHGSFHWRGRVDGSDYIELRNYRVTVRHVQAQPITEAAYDVSSPLASVRHRAAQQVQGRAGRALPAAFGIEQFYASVYIEDNEASMIFTSSN